MITENWTVEKIVDNNLQRTFGDIAKIYHLPWGDMSPEMVARYDDIQLSLTVLAKDYLRGNCEHLDYADTLDGYVCRGCGTEREDD